MNDRIEVRKIHDYLWEIPRTGGMLVPGRVYTTEKMLEAIREEKALEQVMNVAYLPGIQKYSIAMPDIHWGYGFPIGGVAAFDGDKSPAESGENSPHSKVFWLRLGRALCCIADL